jgi:hypothetical protein
MFIPGFFNGLPRENGLGQQKTRPGGPRWFLCLYFYFINLAGWKWTFFEDYIRLRNLGLGGNGVIWGLDKKWAIWGF